jgi:hypothetical protein
MTGNYYVYELIDPRNDHPFYVGKGVGYRDRSHLAEAKRPKTTWTNAIKCERINSIWSQGYEVKIIKVQEHLDEHTAYVMEDALITKYGLLVTGTGILTNVYGCSSDRRTGNAKRQTKEVIQYTMDGDLVQTFPSASQAAAALSVRIASILQCCKGRTNQAYGFRWAYSGEPLQPITESRHALRRKRVECLQDNVVVATFPSIKAAALAYDISAANIVACCKGYRYSHTLNGMAWRYTD